MQRHDQLRFDWQAGDAAPSDPAGADVSGPDSPPGEDEALTPPDPWAELPRPATPPVDSPQTPPPARLRPAQLAARDVAPAATPGSDTGVLAPTETEPVQDPDPETSASVPIRTGDSQRKSAADEPATGSPSGPRRGSEEPAGEAAGRPRRRPRAVGRMLAVVLGVALVTIGIAVVLFAFVRFPGTDAQAAHFQQDLAREFAIRQEADRAEAPVTDAETAQPVALVVKDNPVMVMPEEDLAGGTEPREIEPPPPPPPGIEMEERPPVGDPAGRMVIPKADIDWVMVEGISAGDLQRGPGHWPNTPMPGQPGNAVISGHRTTYGAPFGSLDLLEPGDPIIVETLIGTHTYEVVGSLVVRPTDIWVADQRDGAWLTLTTCHPRYSSRERLVVFARLVFGPNAAAVATSFDGSYGLPEPPAE